MYEDYEKVNSICNSSAFRPAIVADDVKNLTFMSLSLPDGMTNEQQIFEVE